MQDIEIARKATLQPITQIAQKLGVPEEELETYGKYKAKIPISYSSQIQQNKKGKLILVTAINPTPLGEGKTTIAIGLADGLQRIGKKAVLALREPSLGPVFGIKGGATGGGYAQIAPMEDINLHFTGDIHAITSGNSLEIEKVTWKRCLDLNDRQLRRVNTGLSREKNIVPREDGFDISVASEIMAIFCLATDLQDLKRRLGNIVIGYNKQGKCVTARDLKAEGSLTALLKDAFSPNLVQTLENTPAIVHGGPFANIAHGCNSIVATQMALKLGEYVVTEAGFGADLGAEKFLDIKCRKANIKPDAVVCVATIKALKYHGGADKEEIETENLEALQKGIKNLEKHIENLKEKFGLPVVVAINRYVQDTNHEIELLRDTLTKQGVELSLVEAWGKGSSGSEDLAKKVISLCEESSIQKLGYGNLPICIAKTQYSLSDDPKKLEITEPFSITVRDLFLKAGAEFIVVITGKIMTMPGLPKVPAAEQIDVDDNGNIIGIF